MKTWTVVVEISDSTDTLTKEDASNLVIPGWWYELPSEIKMQVFECTEAPYGPQGVVLKDAKP